jgi:tRNA A-37 threonylcarbamoyl transferase component Bud32
LRSENGREATILLIVYSSLKKMEDAAEYTLETTGRASVMIRPGLLEALEASGMLDPSSSPPDVAAKYSGRGNVFVCDLPALPGKKAVVRRYRHGGLSGLIFGGWFAGPSRAFREFRIFLQAEKAGVPTVRVLAASTSRTLGIFYRALLVTEEADGARDLAALAGEAGEKPGAASELRGASRACGAAVRKMHDAGFLHADLNLKNLIVCDEGDGTTARILDWDLSSRLSALSRRARMKNLMRMDRSARKLASKGLTIPLKERLRFLKHYFISGGIDRPSRAELRSWARRSWIHRIAWWVSR